MYKQAKIVNDVDRVASYLLRFKLEKYMSKIPTRTYQLNTYQLNTYYDNIANTLEGLNTQIVG